MSQWQRVADHLFFPLNMWLSAERSSGLGLTPIDHERIREALPFVRGRLLDVACGDNLLVREHGTGVGLDVHPYPEADVCGESSSLPFASGSFDSVAMLACLNHITRRHETLTECRRVLKPDGVLVATMIPEWVGRISHPIRRPHDPDQLERGIGNDELLGLSSATMERLLREAGFQLTVHRQFMWRLNNLYVASKLPGQSETRSQR